MISDANRSIEDLLLSTLDAVSRFRMGRLEAVSAVLDAGRLLTEAKRRFPHGEWGDWLGRVGLAPRTASRWMRLAARRVGRSGCVRPAARAGGGGGGDQGCQGWVLRRPEPAPADAARPSEGEQGVTVSGGWSCTPSRHYPPALAVSLGLSLPLLFRLAALGLGGYSLR